jgi:tight adherence protein C
MNYTELGGLALVFVMIWSAAFSLLYRVGQWRRTQARLKRGPATEADMGSRAELLLGTWTPGLAAQVPMAEDTREDLQKDLRAAGYYRKAALVEYAAVRTVLVVTPLVVAGVLALLVDQERMGTVVAGGVVVAMLGYSLPRVYLHLRGKNRARQIERALPIMVDMLTLCLSAGQNLIGALRRVGQEMKFCHPVFAEELDIIRQQADLRSLPHALQQFADRVQVGEVRNLAMILIQSERLGTDTCAALLEYAANLRTTQRQRADAQANSTMFWMLFPTLLCLWIPAGIVLIGPAVLEFQEHRKAAMEEWQSAKEELRQLAKEMEADNTADGGTPFR